MADVFISYARPDQPVGAALSELLESEGWDVWYDQDLRAGERWEERVLARLNEAKVVVVLWSAHALKSTWVRREAQLALETGKLVPAVIDDTMPGPPFAAIEAALLRGWTGSPDHPELPVLFGGLQARAEPSRNVRPGYDDTFLGTEIGLPEIPGPGDEFPYMHFSVVMNPARRLAWYVIANVRPRADVPRGSRWLPDPTLPLAFQPGDELYRGSGFDRGHLATPYAVSWGPRADARVAMDQAFFWTNTSPQTREFNAFSWHELEAREQEAAVVRGGVVGISGPVFAADDEDLGGVQVRGRLRSRGTFRVPRTFFKVVVAAGKDGDLALAAHWIENAPKKTSPVALTVAELEGLTGLRFPEVLHEAGPLGGF